MIKDDNDLRAGADDTVPDSIFRPAVEMLTSIWQASWAAKSGG